MASGVRIADGSFDFSGGIDSGRVTTVVGPNNPHGLPRSMLAWLTSGTVRQGGIQPRNGFQPLVDIIRGNVENDALTPEAGIAAAMQAVIRVTGPTPLFQGQFLYEPFFANPYLVMSVGGRIYKVLVEAPFTVTDLSAQFGLVNPATPVQAYFVQGEQFLVIQAGDGASPNPTLPLFWDGTILRRSVGLAPAGVSVGTYTLTTTIGWVVPNVGATVVVTLASPYPGSVGDVLQWPGFGTFTVNSISGNTVTLVDTASTQVGNTVTPGTYVIPTTPGPATTVHNVTTTNAPVQPFFPGNTLNAVLNAPYTGAVGDSVNWIGVGTYTVLGLTNANQTVSLAAVTLQAPQNAPIGAGAYTWVATGPSTPSTNVAQARTTSTAPNQPFPGGTINVTVTVAFTGTAGDTVYWIQNSGNFDGIGIYKLLGLSGGGTVLSLQLVTAQANPGTNIGAGNYVFIDVPSAVSGGGGGAVGFVPELPAAGPMVYYAGRIWYAQGRKYTAGDIVFGPSGTLPYNFTDSILKVTENPLAIGGDGFTVPSQAGNITALTYTSNLDTSLGQGPLYIFTTRQVYQLQVPVTRTAWIAAGSANMPLQTVAQIKYGSTSDRCVVHVNGDLFYQSLEPAIRSLFVSTRYFEQWGNIPISRNENRVLQFNNRALMALANGIQFDNRLLQAILPVQTPVGVGFQAIAPLDFDIISSFGQEESAPPPAWEGMWEGMDVLQLSEGDFGGRQRAFATVHSRVDGSIQVWELTDFAQTDNGDDRIPWYFETPAYNFFKEFEMKKLTGGEIWIDSISGTVELQVQYRSDADPCWQDWHRTEFCAARNSCEDASNPVCSQYPLPTLCEGHRFPITLPNPPAGKCATMNQRPVDTGYQFQVKVILKGWCRIRGLIIYGEQRDRGPYEGLKC
jgi:hypothetical protein